MVQWVPWPLAPASHVGPSCLLLIQLPANGPEEAAEDGSNAWAPAPMWGMQVECLTPGFGLAQIQLLLPFGD